MAISRIGGKALKANLERDSNLTFDTDTLVIDYANGRVGVKTANPSTELQITGTATATYFVGDGSQLTNIPTDLVNDSTPQLGGDLDVNGSNIVSSRSNEDIIIDPNGTGAVILNSDANVAGNFTLETGVHANKILDEDDLNSNDDEALATQQSIKAYVDSQVAGGGVNGMLVALSTPTDGSLTTDGAYQGWTTSTKVTDAIDDLNEVTENIRNNTFIKDVTFTASVTAGGSGFSTTLSISAIGTADQYVIDWGDGTSNTTTSSTSPSHTYTNYADSPHSITVTASNTSGSGTGSSATFTRTDYIAVYTPDPTVAFEAYAASSGGSAITSWDDGATIYFQNNSTNTDIDGATIQWTWDWGDSQSDDVISNDTDAGSQSGGRIAHTFDTASEAEQQFTVRLTLDTMSTADPAVIPINTTDTFKIYDTHTPTVTLDDDSGVNEEATSGHVVQLTNTTEAGVGSQATYGITYQYQFGDGTSNVNVNAGSGSAGDRNQALSHTYALSSSDQANGTARDYTGNLRVISNHTSSPFISSTFSVHVEPDVRANIAGTAVTVNTGSGDNNKTIYDFTDLDGVNRAIVRMTNTSQNADDYVYDWDDSSSNDSVTEDGSSAGSIGATLDHDYAGEGTANYNVSFTANGTPDITAQTDTDTGITFNLKATPAAPANLSTKTITLSDTAQGTLPRLAVGFTDNTGSATALTAGADLTTSSSRRYTSGTLDTSTASNFYNGATGTLAAEINGSDDGTKTFTASENETGTFTSLVVTSNVDYDTVVSSYPQRLYLVASAKITKAASGYSTGLSAQRLTHTTTGNTNYVHILKDDMTSSPSFGTSGSLSAGTNGTYRYVSGIPYYNSGSPTVNITGMTINNLVGQAYTNQSNIVEVDSGTNYEGTSSAASNANDYSYSDIDGATTMLDSGTPKVNIGTSSAYAIGDLSVPITTSSVRTVETIKARARNVNGISSYSELSTKLQVHTAAQSGISEIAIAVSDSLGAGYDDDGVRVFDFSSDTTDTPSYTDTTNFYTNSVYTESADPGVAGTKEATIRLGVLKHDVTDYSTGYLPAGPDRSGDTGTQYFTFAFRRTTTANFDINITSSSGIAGCWYAAPGTTMDDSSGLNGWIEATTQYNGVGLPGSDTGNGGNGSDGGAFTGGDVIPTGSSLNSGYTMTLGTANLSNATGNVCLVRIALTSGQSITALSIGVAA